MMMSCAGHQIAAPQMSKATMLARSWEAVRLVSGAHTCSHSSLDCSLGMSGKKSRSMMASSASAHSSSSRTSGFLALAAEARGRGGAMSRLPVLPAESCAAAVWLAMVPRPAGRGPPEWDLLRRGWS